ncbi:amidohydrolase family protein [Paenibacillus medicaginis]|uniref:Amidohydrolase family protein n=1 Tax=Paenibacillus medicaginis TaxID=1470560 RepID=A0ABV5BYK8_9BACL
MSAAAGRMHFINARLPLREDNQLYELKAEGGKWISIRQQSGFLDAAAAGLIRPLIPALAGTDLKKLAEAECIDLQGGIILPGLVDCHMHLDKAFSLEQVSNLSGTLQEAIHNYSQAVPDFSKEQLAGRMLAAARLALSNGTTTIRSHLDFPVHLGKEVAFRTIAAALEVREKLSGSMNIQYSLMVPFRGDQRVVDEAVAEALRMGIDVLGGAPHLADDPEGEISRIFRLAEQYGVPVDLHADESDDPGKRTVLSIAEHTIRYGYQGRVTAGHLCSLSAMDEKDAQVVITKMKDARLNAVTLPAVNLYLQGRDDRGLVRRGTTRIRELLTVGIPLAAASDNIQDPFHPFGRGDLTQIAQITSYAAHMGGEEDLVQLLRMITDVPAGIVGSEGYGIQEGNVCNFVVTDAADVTQLLSGTSLSRWVYSCGGWQSGLYAARAYAMDNQ